MPKVNDECLKRISRLDSPVGRGAAMAVRALEKKPMMSCVFWALSDASVSTRSKALLCEILYRVRWPEAVPVLIQQLGSSDAHVVAIAADALGAIGDESAGPFLVPLLEARQQPTSVRDTAALALGTTGYHPAWVLLVECLRDPEKTVRYNSAKALFFLSEPGSVDKLRHALKWESDDSVREELILALASARQSLMSGKQFPRRTGLLTKHEKALIKKASVRSRLALCLVCITSELRRFDVHVDEVDEFVESLWGFVENESTLSAVDSLSKQRFADVLDQIRRRTSTPERYKAIPMFLRLALLVMYDDLQLPEMFGSLNGRGQASFELAVWVAESCLQNGGTVPDFSLFARHAFVPSDELGPPVPRESFGATR